jgi:DNA polymerase-3 subunit alpha
MRFYHLHVHSHYSLLDGLPKIDELLDYCQELGMDAIALTDHGAIYGAVEFYKKAKERKIKPVIGAELYLAFEKMHQKRVGIDDKRYHLLLLVKNAQGYKNLVKLITKAHLEGFYYKPRIDEDLLFQHSQGLICLSACLQGKIPRLILEKKFEEAEKTALKYQEVFGKENFYLELQHHPNIKEQKIVNEGLIKIAKKYQIPLVATNDAHYLRKEDAESQDILMLINTGADPNDPERLTMKEDDFSLKSPQEMIESFKEVPEAIENTEKIVSLCNFEFELGKVKLPVFPTPDGILPHEYLKKLCFEGLKRRYGEKPKEEVIKRLNYELEVIEKTGFSSYFLIVQDVVRFAKENRIVVGPGRGSVGGSLVAFCLGITEIDPLKYNLLFERFLNPERISLPDIDLDFTDRRRDEVIEYVSQKYGKNRVAQIITFGTMAARAVVRDVGRVLGYPYSYCDKIAKTIPFGLNLNEALAKVVEFRQFYETDEKARKLLDLALKLEGCARHASTHACGVVISNEPLDEIVPLQHPTQDEKTIVTQFEMRSIEDLGLLKMDFLGLKNLTIIEDTLGKIFAIHKKSIDIGKIPLQDKKTFQLLSKGDSVGVFQLESDGMRRCLRELKPNNIEDIIAILALYRPGPMQFISDYIAGKRGKKKIEYLHPKLKPILESTYGICIYQEQVMQIAQHLAGFTLGEADVLRKAIGKKIGELLKSQKEKFIEGCKKNNISETIATNIWNWFEPFARYSFNRSHAAAYALIAYQTAFLKAHYPLEFMASLLTADQNDVERIGFLIEECKKMGIEVLGPDINESYRNFSVVPDKKQIRFGLLAIKNVGENTVEAILEERKRGGQFKSIADFLNRIPSKELNKKSLESLIKAGVFDRFEERNTLLANLENLLEWNRENQAKKTLGQRGLFDTFTFTPQIKLKPATPANQKQKAIWEKELLGLYINSHPVSEFKELLQKKAIPIAKIYEKIDFRGKLIKVGGVISAIKKVITKNGKPMLFTKLEDEKNSIEVVVFPTVILKNPEVFQENKIVLVEGRVDEKDGVPKIICENIEEILES